MHFIGVDLAWGDVKPTGLAVLDGDGALLHVSSAGTDETILAALAPYVEGSCLVAIDAPLIVTNPTGNRPAEKALNKDFARFHAGAHPANTGKPEFADQPRGARIARQLGLDVNPRSGRPRRAIEVYPHPATIALFRLGRTLKYKAKPSRTLHLLRSELLLLMDLLEGLAAADPPLLLRGPLTDQEAAAHWESMRAAVESATRKVDLRAVEDQVDAVLCAYLALLAARHPERMTTYGDVETGYIVTPTLPEDLTPTPSTARTDDPAPAASPAGVSAGAPTASSPAEILPTATSATVGAAVGEYASQHPVLRRAADQYALLVSSILDDAGINYLTVTGRAKSVDSFAAKAARTVQGAAVFADPLRDIHDQIGIRVITYVHSDVQAVADLIQDQLIVHEDRDMGQETASEGRFGYASRHLLVTLDAVREAQPGLEVLQGRRAQIQVRTVLQHAWAEFEHDIRYKGTVPDEHRSDFDRRFTLAAGLLELADREFSTIRDRLRSGVTGPSLEAADDDPRIAPRELAAFLAGQYADAGWSRTERYAWMSQLLLELGITSLADLATRLRAVDGEALTARMRYRYPPGAVRRLDDALLWSLGEEYVELRGNADRVPALRSRLERMSATG